MPDYQSVFEGKQIDEGIGKIINGGIDKAVLDAQTAAGQAENALSGVTARLDVVPTGSTQIINDLTTGGAGSALSAGMGKQLRIEAEKHESDAVKHIGTAKKAAAADGDSVVLVDSADAGKTKRLLWGSIKALFAPATHGHQITDVANLESSLSNKADKTPPVEYDLPLADVVTGSIFYSKDQFGTLMIPGICVTATRQIMAGGTIATLPAGYRPRGGIGLRMLANIGNTISNLYIDPNGSLMVSVSVAQGGVICTGSISFVAG